MIKGYRIVSVVTTIVTAALALNNGVGDLASQQALQSGQVPALPLVLAQVTNQTYSSIYTVPLPQSLTPAAPPRECVPAVFVHGILGAIPFTTPPTSPPPLDSPQVPLYNELKANGYAMNETLFGFSYDWRQDNNISASQLNDYIENVVKTSIEKRTGTRPNKVALIGHSMGGFVSRRYYATFGQGKVDQLLTVDNPYGGAADVFIDFGGLNGHFSQYLDSATQLYPTWQAVYDQFGGPVPSNGVPQGYNPWIQNNIWPSPQPDVVYYSRDNQTTDTVTRDFQRFYDIFGNLVAQYTYWTARTTSLGDGRVLDRSATAQIASTAVSPVIIHGNHTGTIPYTFPTDPSRGAGGVVEDAAPLILKRLQDSPTGGPDECAKYTVKAMITPRTTVVPACTPSAYQIQLFDAKTQQAIANLAQGEKMRIDVSGVVGTGYFTVTTPTYSGSTAPAKGPGDISVVARVYDKDGAKLGEGGEIAIVKSGAAPIKASACGPVEAVFDPQTCGWKFVATKAQPCLPDDTMSVATVDTSAPSVAAPPHQPAALASVNATIGVLDNGYGGTMLALLQKQGISAAAIPIDFSPEIVSQYPVLIIPTGGLNGYAQSDAMRARLAQYASSGGVLISFAQQNGDEFGLLPGGKLRGYGYDQDVNCRVDSARIATFAPMLVSQPSEVLSLNIDGFFTDWDRASSTVLLNRTLNGSPAMLVYPYGQGYVLATTAYPDTASEQGLGTPDDLTTLRDLVTWALNPGLSVDRFGSNQSVTLPLTATNHTTTGTNYLVYTVYNADGQTILSTDPVTVALTSGQTKVLTTSIAISQLQTASTSPYGYWHVQLKLLDGAYNAMQSDDYAYRFASVRFTQAQQGYGYPDQPYAVSINSLSSEYVYGSTPAFTFNVFNNATQTKTLRLDYSSGAFVQDITRTVLLTVPASSSVAYSDTLPALALSGQVAADLSLNGQPVAHAQRPFSVNYAPLSQTVTTNKPFYNLGDIPVLTVTDISQTTLPFTVTSALNILDRNYQTYFTDTRTLTVTPFVPVVYTFTLPALNSQNWGYYDISINNLINGALQVGTTGRLIVPPLSISTDLVTLPRIATSSTITFTNSPIGAGSVFNGAIGGVIVSSTFAISLTRPNGSVAWSAIQSLPTLTSGVPITTIFTIGNIGPVEFGNYTLNYAISSPNGYQWVLVHRLMPSQDTYAQYTNQIYYHVRDQVVLNTQVLNIGLFDLNPLVTVSVPDLGISATKALTMPAGSGVIGTFPLTFTIPTTASAGSGIVYIDVKQSTGVHRRSSAIYILPFDIALSALAGPYGPGQTVPVTVTNTGGEDAVLSYSLVLRNGGRSLTLLQNVPGLALPVGASVVLTPLIPADATTGAYRLDLTGTDTNSGQPFDEFAPANIVNTSLTVTGRTDQPVYLTTDAITVTGRITSSVLPVSGTLGLTIGSDGLSQYWQTYNTGNSGLFNNSVTAVATDQAGNTYFGVNAMGYSGTDVRISQLLPDMLTWQTYQLPGDLAGVSAVKHIAVGPDQRVWVATNAGAAVLSADRTAWTSYLATTSPLVNNWVNAVSVAPNGDAWFGTINGANLYTSGGQWYTYTVANGLTSNYIYAIKQDSAGNTWFGTDAGLTEYTHAGAWITYTSSNSGLLSNNVLDIDLDPAGNVWMANPPVVTQGGVSALLAASGWLTFTTSNSGLAGSNVTAISVGSDGRKWVGYDTLGVSVLSADNTTWQTYTSPVIGSNTINGLALALSGDIWAATQPGSGAGGASRGYAVAGEKNILWARETPVNLGAPGAFADASTLTAASLGVTGRLTLRAVYTAASGYVAGTDAWPFYIYPAGPVLTLNADHALYKPGQTLTATGGLLNNTGSTLTNQAITVTLNGAIAYTSGLFSLANNATRAFTVSVNAPLASGQFTLVAATPLQLATLTPRVAAPQLSAMFETPMAVGGAPYTVTIVLTNTGEVALNLSASLLSSALRPDAGFTLAPGDVIAIPNTVLGGRRTLTATIQGDVSLILTRTLPWGEGASVAIGAPAGNVIAAPSLITYTVVNTGVLAFTAPFTIALDGLPVFTTALSLQPQQAASGELVVNPGVGMHTLLAQTPYAQQSAAWVTVASGGISVTIDAVNAPAQLIGLGTVTVTLANHGPARVDGRLAVTTTFFYADAPFSLAPSETRDVALPLDATHAPAGGAYTLGLIASANTVTLGQVNRTLLIAGPSWQVTMAPLTLFAGKVTTVPVTVTNVGGLGSNYTLGYNLDGIFTAVRTGSAAPGASGVYTFVVATPPDIEARTSTGHVTINGADFPFTYTIAGPQLALGAVLAPRVAPEGSPVSLTLFITDTSGQGAPIPLIARASGAGDPQAKLLTLVNSAQVTFVITAPQTDALLSFGVYHPSGRSLVLDTRRLYVIGDPRSTNPLVVYPNRPLYHPGDTVTMTAIAAITGTFDWRALDYSGTLTLTPNLPSMFNLPLSNVLVAGTYAVTVRFDGVDGRSVDARSAFEVDTNSVAIKEVTLNATTSAVACSGTVTPGLRLDVRSSAPLTGVIAEWNVLAPDGALAGVTQTMALTLPAGVSWWTLPPVAFASGQGGTYLVSINLHQGTRSLASAFQAFDVGSALLLGLTTPRTYYRPGQALTATTGLIDPTGLAITLTTWVNGLPAGLRTISGTGYLAVALPLGSIPFGTQAYSVTMTTGAGICRSTEAHDLIAAPSPPLAIVVSPVTGDNAWHTITPTVLLDMPDPFAPMHGRFTWDNSATQSTDTGAVTVTLGDGAHIISATAFADDEGMAGPVTTSLKIDRVLPTISATLSDGALPTVTLVATDTTSGIAAIQYRINAGAWQSYTVPLQVAAMLDYRAVDNAGNYSLVGTLAIAGHYTYLPMLRKGI